MPRGVKALRHHIGMRHDESPAAVNRQRRRESSEVGRTEWGGSGVGVESRVGTWHALRSRSLSHDLGDTVIAYANNEFSITLLIYINYFDILIIYLDILII